MQEPPDNIEPLLQVGLLLFQFAGLGRRQDRVAAVLGLDRQQVVAQTRRPGVHQEGHPGDRCRPPAPRAPGKQFPQPRARLERPHQVEHGAAMIEPPQRQPEGDSAPKSRLSVPRDAGFEGVGQGLVAESLDRSPRPWIITASRGDSTPYCLLSVWSVRAAQRIAGPSRRPRTRTRARRWAPGPTRARRAPGRRRGTRGGRSSRTGRTVQLRRGPDRAKGAGSTPHGRTPHAASDSICPSSYFFRQAAMLATGSL